MNDAARFLLPAAPRVLAVCAHPDDESFGLGAVISTFTELGSAVDLVCLTRGEASTLSTDGADLAMSRTTELGAAARELGLGHVALFDHPDGRLATEPLPALVTAIRPHAIGSDLLLVFDEGGITGHPDHMRATEAAMHVAHELGLPVLAWTLRDDVARILTEEFAAQFIGRHDRDIDISLTVDRRRQRSAMRCHASQLADNPVPARRLALTGDIESLRYLRR